MTTSNTYIYNITQIIKKKHFQRLLKIYSKTSNFIYSPNKKKKIKNKNMRKVF